VLFGDSIGRVAYLAPFVEVQVASLKPAFGLFLRRAAGFRAKDAGRASRLLGKVTSSFHFQGEP
jgi:hypothetical protein